MEQYIILANIGNRNVRYLDQGFEKGEIPKSIFLEKTKFLLDNPEEWGKVKLQLIPELLSQFPQAHLYLFVTKQNPLHSQDTLFEGYLLKELIRQSYQNIQTEVIEMEGIRPYIEDELISWYKTQVQILRAKWPESTFIMYDTGGTPQQKNALKTVLDFYFKDPVQNSFKQNYMLLQGLDLFDGTTKISEIRSTASEMLAQLTNIKILCHHFHYEGALQLSYGLNNKNLNYLLEYTNLRWNNMWKEIRLKKPVHNFPKAIKVQSNFKVIEDVTEEIIMQKDNEDILPVVARECANLIAKSMKQSETGNLSGAILSLHQCAESFIAGMIETHSEFKLYSDYRNAGKELLRELSINHYEECFGKFGFMPNSVSLPILIFFASKCPPSKNPGFELIEEFRLTQSFFKEKKYPQNKKLDSIRNAIAHEGHGVTVEEFAIYKPFQEALYRFFVKEQNPFDELNVMIEAIMQ